MSSEKDKNFGQISTYFNIYLKSGNFNNKENIKVFTRFSSFTTIGGIEGVLEFIKDTYCDAFSDFSARVFRVDAHFICDSEEEIYCDTYYFK